MNAEPTVRPRALRRIGVASLAKTTAIAWLLVGIFEGVLVGVGCSLLAAIAGAQGQAEQLGGFLFLGVIAFVGLPVAGVLGGYFAGLIGAFSFNLACRASGGIELELD